MRSAGAFGPTWRSASTIIKPVSRPTRSDVSSTPAFLFCDRSEPEQPRDVTAEHCSFIGVGKPQAPNVRCVGIDERIVRSEEKMFQAFEHHEQRAARVRENVRKIRETLEDAAVDEAFCNQCRVKDQATRSGSSYSRKLVVSFGNIGCSKTG